MTDCWLSQVRADDQIIVMLMPRSRTDLFFRYSLCLELQQSLTLSGLFALSALDLVAQGGELSLLKSRIKEKSVLHGHKHCSNVGWYIPKQHLQL